MSDDNLAMSLRKYPETLGVSSRQKTGEAVRDARHAGTFPAGSPWSGTRANFRLVPPQGASIEPFAVQWT